MPIFIFYRYKDGKYKKYIINDEKLRDAFNKVAKKDNLTSLTSVVDGKASISHSHNISDISNLQTSLDAKANDNAVVKLSSGSAQTITSEVIINNAGANPNLKLTEPVRIE